MKRIILAVAFAFCCEVALSFNQYFPTHITINPVINGVSYSHTIDITPQTYSGSGFDSGWILLGGIEFQFELSVGSDGKSLYPSFRRRGGGFPDRGHSLPDICLFQSGSYADYDTWGEGVNMRINWSAPMWYSISTSIYDPSTCDGIAVKHAGEKRLSLDVYTVDTETQFYKNIFVKDITRNRIAGRGASASIGRPFGNYVVCGEKNGRQNFAPLINDLAGDGKDIIHGTRKTNEILYNDLYENLWSNMTVRTWWEFSQNKYNGEDSEGNVIFPQAKINSTVVCEQHSTSHIVDYHLTEISEWDFDPILRIYTIHFTMSIIKDDTATGGTCIFHSWVVVDGKEEWDDADDNHKASIKGNQSTSAQFTLKYYKLTGEKVLYSGM